MLKHVLIISFFSSFSLSAAELDHAKLTALFKGNSSIDPDTRTEKERIAIAISKYCVSQVESPDVSKLQPIVDCIISEVDKIPVPSDAMMREKNKFSRLFRWFISDKESCALFMVALYMQYHATDDHDGCYARSFLSRQYAEKPDYSKRFSLRQSAYILFGWRVFNSNINIPKQLSEYNFRGWDVGLKLLMGTDEEEGSSDLMDEHKCEAAKAEQIAAPLAEDDSKKRVRAKIKRLKNARKRLRTKYEALIEENTALRLNINEYDEELEQLFAENVRLRSQLNEIANEVVSFQRLPSPIFEIDATRSSSPMNQSSTDHNSFDALLPSRPSSSLSVDWLPWMQTLDHE